LLAGDGEAVEGSFGDGDVPSGRTILALGFLTSTSLMVSC
jgi:hypothetical protein